MSAGIMPDIYRHTARKSTVTKALKSSLVNCKSNNNSTIFHQDKLYQSIEYKIKLEDDIHSQPEDKFIILPNNELEEMIVNTKETNEEIIMDICEQIINQIVQSSTDQIRRNSTNEMQIDNIECKTPSNVNRNSIETDTSHSTFDDDNLELTHHLCTCQCHHSDRFYSNDYCLFEQALKQTRCEQEKFIENNRLIQTLKRQHDELMQIYQQNKYFKQQYQKKIDREQQTIQLDLHDSPAQTDMITLEQKKISNCQQSKSIVTKLLDTQILQSIIPCLPANNSLSSTITTTTTTLTNANNSHEIVDLTDEDDEDNLSSQIPMSIRRSTSSVTLPSLSPLPLTPISLLSPLSIPSPTLPTATRTHQVTRPIRPNNSTPNTQLISLRALPEHIPCDHTIARPQLSITQENATVRLTWNLHSTPMESIKNYEIYAYRQNATAATSDWRKIGTVKSMRLPMAVTLKEFQANSHYAFAVRAISVQNHIGPFCEPKTIFTGLNSVQPLHTSQLLNLSTK